MSLCVGGGWRWLVGSACDAMQHSRSVNVAVTRASHYYITLYCEAIGLEWRSSSLPAAAAAAAAATAQLL